MRSYLKFTSSIGGRLVISICVILFFTIISVFVAIISLNNIDKSQRKLTQTTIPALVEVDHLSTLAINVVKQSLLMKDVNDIAKLDEIMQQNKISIDNLRFYLNILKNHKLSEDLIDHVERILNSLDSSVRKLYQTNHEIINIEKNLSDDIEKMAIAIESIEDKVSIMKINADDMFLKKLSENTSYQSRDILRIFNDEIYDIELMASIILSSGELRKDLNFISNKLTHEKLLSTQQEFNHSLRKIIRVLVHHNRDKIRENIGEHVNILINLGQDSPDVFDSKERLIHLMENLDNISQDNIEYLQQLNIAILSLADEIRNKTITSSDNLHDEAVNSALFLYAIAFIALIVSLLITWKFIYKNIVLNLANLANITRRLSQNDFNFTVDIKGDSEFKEIATALDSLRDHSLKRISLNKQLSKKSIMLKQSNEDLSQFAYIASHDLQEPLRMIGSYVQLLKIRYENKIDHQADQYINYAVDGCMRMKSLIEGLLEYSRVESNLDEVIDIDCNSLLDEVLQDLGLKISESKANIIVEDLPIISGAPEQIRIVFANLINNSIKYNDKEFPVIQVGSELQNDKIRFFVKDNGIGIKEKYQEKIFVIFKRLHSRSEYSGTGIGLSISKKIIERHGGEITITSTPGEGSCFYFTLPMSGSSLDLYKIAV